MKGREKVKEDMNKGKTKSKIENVERSVVDRVKENLKARILRGEFSTTKRFPSERKLGKEYSASRITVRHAISELVAEGYLFRIPFKGTYISKDISRQTIQLIVNPPLNVSFFADILEGIEKEVSKDGNKLLLKCTDENAEIERRYLEKIREEKLDGLIIISGVNSLSNVDLIKDVSHILPVVVVDIYLGEVEADYITSDDEKGGYLATKHLIELGNRKILHLAGPLQHSTARGRLNGYKKALEEFSIDFDEEMVRYTGWSIESGYYEAKKFLMNTRVDGIFAANDEIAVGAFKAIRELGLSVPSDISIIGYGNLTIGRYLEVPLTTVDQKPEKVGAEAYRVLMERLKGERNSHTLKKVVMDVELIIRESCGIQKQIDMKKGGNSGVGIKR
ncbi:MAG: GntR family transcriptional regulator [Candidatus Omnitrophica bacterium]|nr:GntR family transcriptional regulator [Candidatus Omnitrophota bacterium]